MTVGENVATDFQLKVTGVKQVVEVLATPPAVDTTQGQQANTVEEKLIRDLPINRRDYLTYTLLSPAVSDSTRLASDQDFRVKQTPQSGLSFYGSNGRGNSVTVDGGEANDDSGGVRLTLSQDAVQEFQINRSNYMADLGGANGASINIVSKTGTNDVHGSAFGFFRFTGLDARNPFSYSQALAPGQTFNPAVADLAGVPVKDQLKRQQFGGTAGFPIKKNKTFMFLAFEGLRELFPFRSQRLIRCSSHEHTHTQTVHAFGNKNKTKENKTKNKRNKKTEENKRKQKKTNKQTK